MPSTITVKLAYEDRSKSYSETYQCADSHPSAAVVKDCESTTVHKWVEMGGSLRTLKIDVSVKQVG